jgi:hypothetical protein
VKTLPRPTVLRSSICFFFGQGWKSFQATGGKAADCQNEFIIQIALEF